jgi:CO/xanthine dehydrogenase FAD-binding subunit
MLSRKEGNDFAVVDLQALSLDKIRVNSEILEIGATTRIQQIVDDMNAPAWLRIACVRETSRNLREMGTIAGFLVCATGRSPLAIALLAADLHATVLPGYEELSLSQILSMRAAKQQPWLISKVEIDLAAHLKFEFVARSPADLPALGIAIATWPTGRIRVSVGGFGSSPLLAYDGDDQNTVIQAVERALIGATDQWASEEYRQSIAPAIVQRLLAK